MKFQPDRFSGGNVITRHDPGRIWVGATAFSESLVVPWSGDVLRWQAASADALTIEHFEFDLQHCAWVALLHFAHHGGHGHQLGLFQPWFRNLVAGYGIHINLGALPIVQLDLIPALASRTAFQIDIQHSTCVPTLHIAQDVIQRL